VKNTKKKLSKRFMRSPVIPLEWKYCPNITTHHPERINLCVCLSIDSLILYKLFYMSCFSHLLHFFFIAYINLSILSLFWFSLVYFYFIISKLSEVSKLYRRDHLGIICGNFFGHIYFGPFSVTRGV